MGKLAVIALGGNALLRDNQIGTIEEQEQNTTDTLENIVFLLKEGYNIVISHGNGPQVGNIVMRNDAGEQMYNIPQMPLDVCVADSQGGIGYMIERSLKNVMRKHGIDRNVLTLMTTVEVDPEDEAFKNPTKRIGKIVSKEEADKLSTEKGWTFKEEKKTTSGYRRVVPSPQPKTVGNWEVIEKNARQGTIIIAVGGGGVPVYTDEKGDIRPIEAVIDKDLANSLLARQINADRFYILTDVPFVYTNFGEPDQKVLEFLNVEDTKKYMEAGTFGEGSMAPKINAALQFVEGGGDMSVITEATKLEDKAYGTKITAEYEEADLKKYNK
ncbi:carbamate kinase [Carboxylicivirga sp. A043]|uniref:carbamate kinase n=1 Tax=Carboxylicivirga litoralis TaxID=2816963 RepID=UPI0021CAF39B|nr:carbamate kinase [Carboxylicivirga sp. A043]MCU4155598.1 carbamate kinase [Carboxylicivirga sp. A043]